MLTATAVAGSVLEVEGLQGECFVEADGANLLAYRAADNIARCTLSEESGCSFSDGESRSLSSVLYQ
jgi:hypothetical protein